METAQEKETPRDWRAGIIFGFVTACSDQFYGLICETCWKRLGECQCKQALVSTSEKQ